MYTLPKKSQLQTLGRVLGQEDNEKKKTFSSAREFLDTNIWKEKKVFDSSFFRARRQHKEKNNFLAVRVFKQEDNTIPNDSK